ncbi:transmembrane amino acid transporter protein-domain-containing protein, partial [Mycena leptocephala]
LFNSTAILLGIGMLAMPLGLAFAGWGMGIALIIFYGSISCYTAKILARIILSDPSLRSYADIGRKAFGPRYTIPISIFFCLDRFAVRHVHNFGFYRNSPPTSVILVTLFADSLNSLIPHFSSNTYKLWGAFILIPTMFLPLSLLSYASILGIISTVFVVIVLLVDGISKTEAPGSLRSPEETSLGFENLNYLASAFGLFMAGFTGHAVFPSLARDMVNPSEFNKMINWAFIIATLIYLVIASAGYLMFGDFVSDEISLDLLSTPGYNRALNDAALWMLVLSPLSKFALATRPLNTTIDLLIGIDRPTSAEVPEKKPTELRRRGLPDSVKRVLGVVQRVAVALLSVTVSILVPDFSTTITFVGSFSAFVICVIGPIAAKVAIARRCGVFDGFVLALVVVMAVGGTIAAFLDA